jgi:CubicO group peptidase (beta-lactamase class C family)
MCRIFRDLVVTQFFVAILAASTAVADDLEDRIDQVVPAGFSGQIAIGSSDSVLFTKSFGFADREDGTVVANGMLFDIGSITKTFTATAILMLAEGRSVTLDQTVGDFFSKLTAKTSAITIHQLLTHTSGLPLYSGDDDEPCNSACFDLQVRNFNIPIPVIACLPVLSRLSVANRTNHSYRKK